MLRGRKNMAVDAVPVWHRSYCFVVMRGACTAIARGGTGGARDSRGRRRPGVRGETQIPYTQRLSQLAATRCNPRDSLIRKRSQVRVLDRPLGEIA